MGDQPTIKVQILLSNIVDLNKKINLAIGQNIKIEPYCICIEYETEDIKMK